MNRSRKLSEQLIVETALQLLNERGERDFSMRKLASLLDVDAMAIYHHFSNKSDLIHAVLQAMMERCEIPPSTSNWQQDIRNLCACLRSVAKSNPGAFCVYETYERWLPAEHRLQEAFHSVLLKAGFSPKVVVRAVRVLWAYTESMSVDEVSGWLEPANSAELSDSLMAGDYLTLIELVDELTSVDVASEFELGLKMIISGLQTEGNR